MKLDFEYGQGLMSAELPEDTDVFIPGVTVPDPPCIREEDLEQAYLESIRNPIGMKPLRELAFPGAKVVFVIPDRVKGGEQPTSHRKLGVKVLLQELYSAGVKKEDILFVVSNGLHPRARPEDFRAILGDELFGEFWHTHQIISHDSEDPEHMVDLGTTEPHSARACPGQSLRGLLGGVQALRYRPEQLAQHRQPPCARGNAPGRFYTRQQRQPDAAQI